MQAVKSKSSGALLALSCVAALALLIGLGIQVTLGFWRYRESCTLAGELLGRITQRGEAQAETLRGALFSESSGRGALQRLRLERLAAQKGEAQRAKELDLLTLVNPWNSVPAGYTVSLAHAESWYQIAEDYWVDERCAEPLYNMLNDCLRAGHIPILCSAYRTQEYQQGLFDNKIERLIEEGVSPEDAPALAATVVALPGTSEHQLGLAVDIIDEEYPYLDQMQEWTGAQLWLMEHCWDYGFILRYPNGTSEITGIIYEPWHYRYVGEKFAKEITKRGLTLEEYVAWRRGR